MLIYERNVHRIKKNFSQSGAWIDRPTDISFRIDVHTQEECTQKKYNSIRGLKILGFNSKFLLINEVREGGSFATLT